jgi:hypothetical protein
MNIILIILITVGAILSATYPISAAGDTNEIRVVESKVSVNGQEHMLLPAEVLKLDQGNKVQVLAKLSKPQNTSGTVRVLSDLNYLEGLQYLNLNDYQGKTVIPIQFTGTVPSALIRDGELTRVGEKTFTLANIIWEGSGSVDTLLTITSIATTPGLKESATRITQLKTLLQSSSADERFGLAKKVLEMALVAREDGNPALAISLCDLAYKVTDLKISIISPPFWYWLIVLVLAMALITVCFIFLSHRKTKQQGGWIKER